jgi:hypothetical protein
VRAAGRTHEGRQAAELAFDGFTPSHECRCPACASDSTKRGRRLLLLREQQPSSSLLASLLRTTSTSGASAAPRYSSRIGQGGATGVCAILGDLGSIVRQCGLDRERAARPSKPRWRLRVPIPSGQLR